MAQPVSGCSGSRASPEGPPPINFGSVTATTGFAGHGTAAQAPAPAPAAAASGPEAPPPQPASAVKIDNFIFVAQTLTAPVSTTVMSTNQDEEPHAVAATDGSFHSARLDTNGTYGFTFAKPGSYDYVCSIHPFRTDTVVVVK
jgi:plastocyanin